MISKQRKNELLAAYNTINKASQDEKRFLFGGYIASMEKSYESLQATENTFRPHLHIVHSASRRAFSLLRNLTGYSAGWIEEELAKHSATKPGRNKRYNLDQKLENSVFISLLVQRGASKTQAMKLLMRLRGDFALADSHLNELRSTYKEFEADQGGSYRSDDMSENAWAIAEFLKFDITKVDDGKEIAAKEAVEAFRSLWQEIIDIMKEYHPIIRTIDSARSEDYGCVIDWVEAAYEDPLDYFYGHPSHGEVPFEERRFKFLQYLNDITHCSEIRNPEQPVYIDL